MIILKNFFTPTDENERMPVSLSGAAFILYLILAFGLLVAPLITRQLELASLTSPVSFSPSDLLRLTNDARRSAGLGELALNEQLVRAATAKVEDMFTVQYFAHFSPAGKSPWDFLRSVDYRYVAAGENLAIDFATAESTHRALMDSKTHRDNILGNLYTEMGVAVGQGVLNGQPSIIVAEFFGTPRKAVTAAVPPATPAPRSPSSLPSPAAPTVPATPPPAPAVVPPPAPVAAAPAPSPAAPEPVVLGAESPSANLPVPAPSRMVRFVSRIQDVTRLALNPEIVGRAVAFVVLFTTLVSLMFFVTRYGTPSPALFARSFMVLLLFGYILVFGIGEVSAAKVTPLSATTVTYQVFLP